MKQFICDNALVLLLGVSFLSVLIGWLVYRNLKDEDEFLGTMNTRQWDKEHHPKK